MSLVRKVLFVAWQNPTTRAIYPVARLLDRLNAPRWEFAYIGGALAARDNGFDLFYGFGDIDTVTESHELPPLFTNRLMRKNRSDFPAFIERMGLTAEADDLPVLARSEGLRANDPIELFGLPTFDASRDRYRFSFFLRGVRHVREAEASIAKLRAGELLTLKNEPRNPVDGLAICVHEGTRDLKLGWVPATLLDDLHELQHRRSTLEVYAEKVNLHPAPIQSRLLCRLEATRVGDFIPFTSPRYTPNSLQATRIDIAPATLAG